MRHCTFVSTCFCNFSVEVSIHLTRVIGSWNHYFTIVALLPKTVQCNAHIMKTEIIHTGRAGPDKARQRRTGPGRDGKGRTGPDSARQSREVSGTEQCWTVPNRTGMSHEGSVIAGRGWERPEMVGRTGQERKGSAGPGGIG